MKIFFIVLIFTVLISTVVLAGEIHRLDFNENPVQVKEIKEGDLVEMKVENKTQKLILKNILPSKSMINLALFCLLNNLQNFS